MRLWNSTFKTPGKPLQRKTALRSTGAAQNKGLAQRIAESLGSAVQHARGESSLLRSEQHRRNVAALHCVSCGTPGPSQCAHANATKGMGQKVCDSLTFPLCPACHHAHDQGGTHTKAERWLREWEFADATRALLIQKAQWTDKIEHHYQRAIEPIKRVVHE